MATTRRKLDEPLSLLCDVVARGAMNNSLVGIHRIVSAFVFLREILAFMSRLVTVNKNGHENKQQEDDKQ